MSLLPNEECYRPGQLFGPSFAFLAWLDTLPSAAKRLATWRESDSLNGRFVNQTEPVDRHE